MANDLLILTAPPASGKTFWMNSFAKILGRSFLFISPLRALAEECKKNSSEQYEIMTPEEWLIKKPFEKIVIIDEFHLFFYWGDSFRHLMWEAFYELVTQTELVIVLTATLTQNMISEISLFYSQFEEIIWIDQGNQKLKYHPTKYVKLPNLIFMKELILYPVLRRNRTTLIFCQFRSDVFEWESRLREQGYSVLSCVGGGAKDFTEKLKIELAPEFIVATTVLSHGVNLPPIRKIFFTYQVEDINFWIQMLARGGRRGDSFEVYALEKPFGLRWNNTFNYLAIQTLSLKIKLFKLNQQIQEWFLKE